jgi:hypothetical protein
MHVRMPAVAAFEGVRHPREVNSEGCQCDAAVSGYVRGARQAYRDQ